MPSRSSVFTVAALSVGACFGAVLLVASCSSSSGSHASPTGDGSADDATQSDDGGDAAVGLTCGKLLGCDQKCSGNACTDSCYAESTGVAQGLFNAFTGCLDQQCPSTAGGACASSSSSACSNCQTGAATGACINDLLACESDKKVGPPDPDGGGVVVPPMDAGQSLNCGQYTSCVAACHGDAGSCDMTCSNQATPQARALAGALTSCLATACPTTAGGPCAMPGTACNGCEEQTEYGGMCSSAYTACQNDTSNSPDASTTPTSLVEGGVLTPVLTGTNEVGSTMIVQDGYLYFTPEGVSNTVTRISLADGGSSTLGPAQPTPVALALSSTDAYVWNYGTFTGMSSLNNKDGTVARVPLDGGAEQVVGQNIEVFYAAPYLTAIAVDSQNVYWVQGASGSDGQIVREPLGTTNATPLYTGQFFPEAVASDGTNLYWASWGTYDAQGNSNNDGTIQQGSVNGGTAITLAKNLSAPAVIVVDSGNVYWTSLGKMGGSNLPALNTGSVMQVPIGGGTVVTLADQETVPVGIALSGSTVYWTEYGLGSPGLVLSVPKGGGTVTPLVIGLRNPYSLALSSTSLYWSIYSAAPPSSATTLIESLSPY